MPTKRAVIAGIDNYTIFDPSGRNNLFNCANSARSMYRLLQDAFGFEASNMYLYLDLRATRANILDALGHVLSASETGDTVCFYFAGHGGRVRADRSPADCDMYYEALVPAAGSWITDQDLAQLADRLYPDAVNFTVITDACHSGGLHTADVNLKCPSLVYSAALLQAMATYMRTLIPCGLCLPPGVTDLINNISNVRVTPFNTIDLDMDPDKTLIASSKTTLLSACRYNEVAWISSRYQNMMFTQCLLDMIDQCGYEASYHYIMEQVRSTLEGRIASIIRPGHPGITQTPQLFGQRNRMEENFLAGFAYTPAYT